MRASADRYERALENLGNAEPWKNANLDVDEHEVPRHSPPAGAGGFQQYQLKAPSGVQDEEVDYGSEAWFLDPTCGFKR